MNSLSIVVPVKDEQGNLGPLLEEISGSVPAGLDWEVVFVDDGSADNSFRVLEALAAGEPRVRVLRLARNFGQSAALQAGIDAARGDVIVTMDGDRQNDPGDIPRLLEELREGHDVVLGERVRRQDKFLLRRLPSRAANWLIRRVTGVPFRDFGCTMRAMRAETAKSLRLYGEMHRFLSVLVQQGGARVTQVPVNHRPRTSGRTKYNLSRTFRVVLDLITVTFFNRYLTRPMHFFGGGGLLFMATGLFAFLATAAMKFGYGVDMTGNPLLMLSVLLEVIGFQFVSLGLLGEVLARAYFEGQGKPPYSVRQTLNFPAPAMRRFPPGAQSGFGVQDRADVA